MTYSEDEEVNESRIVTDTSMSPDKSALHICILHFLYFVFLLIAVGVECVDGMKLSLESMSQAFVDVCLIDA